MLTLILVSSIFGIIVGYLIFTSPFTTEFMKDNFIMLVTGVIIFVVTIQVWLYVLLAKKGGTYNYLAGSN
jgi:hypothetical protein